MPLIDEMVVEKLNHKTSHAWSSVTLENVNQFDKTKFIEKICLYISVIS